MERSTRYLFVRDLTSQTTDCKKQIEVAQQYGASAVNHGATGKGNDQVRFELSYYYLKPDICVVAPRKIRFFKKYPGRTELLAYAQENDIPVKQQHPALEFG